MKTILVSPDGQKEIVLDKVFLWTLLMGPFYFAYLNVWDSAIVSGILALISGGLSVFIYPFFAERIIIETYKKKGWTVKKEEATSFTML
jgi:hypothetical protein